MKRAALMTLFAASALVLSGCVTVVVPDDNRADNRTPVAEDLDNRTELSCSPGEELLLNSPSTLYTISGPCDEVTVEGTDLIVRAEQIDQLVLRGDRNLVEADSIDEVEISGQSNIVEADEIGEVEINGDRNSIRTDERIDDDEIDVSGHDNEFATT
jgi:hypothetical protein